MPHLEIAEVIDREPAGRCAPVGFGRERPATAREKLGVPRIHVNHPLALRLEEVIEDELDVGRAQIDGRLEAQLEVPVARMAGGKRLELHEHRRHEVEGDLDVGKLLQKRHRPVVVLQRVQPDPRQDVLVGGQVLLKGLVHVPDERPWSSWYL